MWRVLQSLLGVMILAASARASPFWVRWEEGWPNEQGWLDDWTNPAPERWLDGSLLYIDSRATGGAGGYYQLPETLTPGPGEAFRLAWRVRVDACWPISDPGVIAKADDRYSVAFTLDVDSIHSNYEPGHWAPFTPNQFHDFVLESMDLRAYNLYIDGVLALQGTFFESLFPGPYVSWGDGSTARSLSAWDSVEYGIVPVPSALLCVLPVLCCPRSLKRSATAVLGTSRKRENHMKARIAALTLIAVAAGSASAENMIVQWKPGHVLGEDYQLDYLQGYGYYGVRIIGNPHPEIPWKFEAFDSETDAPGDIDYIYIDSASPVAGIELSVIGNPSASTPHEFGARDLKAINLTANGTSTNAIVDIKLARNLATDDSVIVPRLSGNCVVGDPQDPDTGQVLNPVELACFTGRLECNELRDFTVAGGCPDGRGPTLIIHGGYAPTP